jgi:hypothetical protein
VNVSVAVGVSNQTGTQTQNASSATARVEFQNQTTNGSTVTVESVTLARPGYVALHTGAYAKGLAPADTTVIAVSQRLSAGTHRNLTINVSNAPPGTPPGLSQSQVNNTQTLAVAVYADTNGNHRYDYVRSYGENDTLVTNNGTPVRDAARVRVSSLPQPTASVVFGNQTLRNGTLVVQRARLPDGGFVVAHNASYQRGANPVTSVVGISKYLAPGNHTNVTLDVAPGALNQTQVVTVRPARDTNENRRYDFVRSGGFQDVAYEKRASNQSRVITASALVRVPGSNRTAQMGTVTQTPMSAQTTPTTGEGASPTTTAQGSVNASDAPLGLSWLQLGLGALVVVVVLPTLVRRLR